MRAALTRAAGPVWSAAQSALAAVLFPVSAAAAPLNPSPPGASPVLASVSSSATVAPGIAKIGQRVIYQGRVLQLQSPRYKWLPPESSEVMTWGRLEITTRYGRPPVRRSPQSSRVGWTVDTLLVEAPLQVFRTGVVTIPGLKLEVDDWRRSTVYRLPTVNLIVTSVLSAADSNADLRPVRGPIGAPWWERVPWRWVALGAAALTAVAVGVKLRRPKPAAPGENPVLDPVAAALSELLALRGLHLPAHGRFAEHAFHLSRIARRFLEAVAGTPCPGDTSGELIRHLESSSLDPEDVVRLAGMLRLWDRVKFARAPSSVDEATSAERAVEALVRRHAPALPEQAA